MKKFSFNASGANVKTKNLYFPKDKKSYTQQKFNI